MQVGRDGAARERLGEVAVGLRNRLCPKAVEDQADEESADPWAAPSPCALRGQSWL